MVSTLVLRIERGGICGKIYSSSHMKFTSIVVDMGKLQIAAAMVFIASGLVCMGAETKKVEVKIRPIDAKEAAKVSFTRDIKPILVNNCVECHSTEDRKSNFEVTSVETLKQKGKKAGAGVIPGKPDQSSVVQYIRGLADGPQMPKGEPALSEDELHLIRSWIAAGAKDDSAEIASAKNENASFGNLN